MSATAGIDTSSHTNYLVQIFKERARATRPRQTDKYTGGHRAVNKVKQLFLLPCDPPSPRSTRRWGAHYMRHHGVVNPAEKIVFRRRPERRCDARRRPL